MIKVASPKSAPKFGQQHGAAQHAVPCLWQISTSDVPWCALQWLLLSDCLTAAAAVVAASPRYVAVYYPTPLHIARAMLRVAGVTQQDTVFDLGCGDGRIVITAAEEFGARGVGVELDPALAATAAAAVQDKGLADRVQIKQGDVRGLDASTASVITLYLNEKANRQLLDSLKAGSLRPGTRVVSLFFPVQVGLLQQVQSTMFKTATSAGYFSPACLLCWP